MDPNEQFTPLSEPELQRHALRQSFTVFTFGLALSLWVAYTLQSALQAQAWSRFEFLANNGYENVEKRFMVPHFGLEALRSALLANARLKRQDFHAAVIDRNLLEAFPGMDGFGYVERVPRPELADFLRQTQADQAPDFQIKTQGQADDLYVIKFIEPERSHFRSLGLDLGSEPEQRKVLEQAVRSGQATLSSRVHFKYDRAQGDGFLLVRPLFRQEPMPGDDLARRLQSLQGLIFVPLRVDEVMRGFNQASSGLLTLQLFDGQENSAQNLLFESNPASRALDRDPLFSRVQVLKLGGRELHLRLSSSPAFESDFQNRLPMYAGLGGTLLFGMLALLIWQQSLKRWQALNLARNMTAELQRKAQVADLSENAISLRDTDGRIQWVNAGFSQLTGYNEEEAIGQDLLKLLDRSGATPEATSSMEKAMALGQTCHVETQQRTKDGRLLWVACELQPVRNESRALNGYLEISRDITAQKLMRDKLQQSLQETDVLNRTIRQHALVTRTDLQGVILEVNDAFCRLSGYRRDELVGHMHRDFSSGVHPHTYWAKLWQTLVAGESWHGHICNRAKNGRYYWLDSLIAPFRNLEGQVTSFIAISFDISESKLAERSLARERQTLSNILEGTHAGTWAWNMISGEIDINTQFALMLGYQPQELMPFSFLRWRSLIHQDDLPALDAALQAHLQEQAPGMECTVRLHHKEGRIVWAMLRGKINARNEQGQARWMSGTQIDITGQRQDEEALREAHERFNLAKDSAGIGMWDFDARSKTLQWDARMYALHDIPQSSGPIDLAQWRQAIWPEDQERVAHAFSFALREHTTFDVEFKTCWRQQQMRHLHMCAQVLRDDSGQALRMVGVALDLTALKTAESATHAAQAREPAHETQPRAIPAQSSSEALP